MKCFCKPRTLLIIALTASLTFTLGVATLSAKEETQDHKNQDSWIQSVEESWQEFTADAQKTAKKAGAKTEEASEKIASEAKEIGAEMEAAAQKAGTSISSGWHNFKGKVSEGWEDIKDSFSGDKNKRKKERTAKVNLERTLAPGVVYPIDSLVLSPGEYAGVMSATTLSNPTDEVRFCGVDMEYEGNVIEDMGLVLDAGESGTLYRIHLLEGTFGDDIIKVVPDQDTELSGVSMEITSYHHPL